MNYQLMVLWRMVWYTGRSMILPWRGAWRIAWMVICGLVLAGGGVAIAQEMPVDSSYVEVRLPDPGKVEALKADSDFGYMTADAVAASWWQRFWAWVWQKMAEFMNSTGNPALWDFLFTRLIPWLIVIAAAVLVIVKLSGIQLDSFLSRKERNTGIPYQVGEETIHPDDFPVRIEEAKAAGNYRLAVRLHYLYLLKSLSDKGLIQWHPEKTNHEYLNELPQEMMRDLFRRSTRVFEYVWYGNFPIDREGFEQADREFTNLRAKLV